MLRAITVDVVMGPDGFLELVAHDHAGTLSRRTAREHHDTGTRVRECGLQRMNGRKIDIDHDTHLEKTNRNTDGDSSASERTLVVRDRPGITRQCFQDAGQLKLALLRGHQESRSAEYLRHGLTRARSSAVLRAQSEHVLNLFRRVFLPTTEDV